MIKSCGNSEETLKIHLTIPSSQSLEKKGMDAYSDFGAELGFNLKRAIKLLIESRSNGNFTQSLEMAIWHIERELEK